MSMDVFEAMRARRSVKKWTDRPVERTAIEKMLEAAALAPNHRLTQPWRFYVLGPEARDAYGLALGNRKAKKVNDPALADETRVRTAAEHRALPCMIAVAMTESENEETRREDFGAVMMAVENLCLAAVGVGLGTHIKTGAIMDDPAARAAVGVPEGERIVAVLNVGEPAEVPPEKPREPASAKTVWVD